MMSLHKYRFFQRTNSCNLCRWKRYAIYLLALLYIPVVRTDQSQYDHKYKPNDDVVLWWNTVGPYDNKQETYYYFRLPICDGFKMMSDHHRYHITLGEELVGIEYLASGIDIQFRKNVTSKEYCALMLNEEDRKALIYAVKNHYWYQMYVDNLPIWGILGNVDEVSNVYYLWTHKKFDIGYNGDRIVDINLTSENKVALDLNKYVKFTYEVNWKPSSIKFEDRFNKYLDPTFFEHRIHWFSIFNSFMMAMFLVGLVPLILMQTLRKNYTCYSKANNLEDLKRNMNDSYDRKQVHEDVFHPPSNSLLFCCLISNGYHITLVVPCVILFAIRGDPYLKPGFLLNIIIFVYCITTPVNGYFGSSLYTQMGGKKCIKQMLISASLIPTLVCVVFSCISCVAMYYSTTHIIVSKTTNAMFCTYFFVILPLTLLGSMGGRNLSGQPDYLCRISAIPHSKSEKKWYKNPFIIIIPAGVLPFSSIFIELYLIFTSFWGYKIYYVYGFMLLVFIILVIVTMCVAIICTYFMLNVEDNRWQWASFCVGGSIAFYVYLYSIYYFFFETKMYGLFQTIFYFGYMALYSIILGIMCGALGYLGASLFVRKIYGRYCIN